MWDEIFGLIGGVYAVILLLLVTATYQERQLSRAPRQHQR